MINQFKIPSSQPWGGRAASFATLVLALGALASVQPACASGYYNIAAFWRSSPDPFYCDQGTRNTTCVINRDRTFAAGTTFTGTGNLVVTSTGVIRSENNLQVITITMTGAVTVKTGGSIRANVRLTAGSVEIQTGATIDAKGLGYLGGLRTGNASPNGLGGQAAARA